MTSCIRSGSNRPDLFQGQGDSAPLFNEDRESREIPHQPGAGAADVPAAVPLDYRQQSPGGEVRLEKQALSVFWNHKGFFVLHALADAVWILLAVSWFWLPDSKIGSVGLGALPPPVFIFAALFLVSPAVSFV